MDGLVTRNPDRSSRPLTYYVRACVQGSLDSIDQGLKRKADRQPPQGPATGLCGHKKRIRARRYSDPPSQAVRSSERKTHSLWELYRFTEAVALEVRRNSPGIWEQVDSGETMPVRITARPARDYRTFASGQGAGGSRKTMIGAPFAVPNARRLPKPQPASGRSRKLQAMGEPSFAVGC